MKTSKNNFFAKITRRFNFLQRNQNYRSQKVLALISHSSNSWSLNVVRGAQTYLLNTDIPAEQLPDFDIVSLEIIDGDLTDQAIHTLKHIIARYDAVTTVGATVSVATKNFMVSNKINLPLYCCGVKNPMDFGIVSSLEAHRAENIGVVTGIENDHDRQVQTFLAINPHIRKVAFTYHNTPLLKKVVKDDVAKMKKAFEKRDVEVVTKELSTQKELLCEQIETLAPTVDAITLFRDISVYNAVHDIIRACNKNNTLVFASELVSLLAGAAIGFGDTGFEYGTKLGVFLEELFCNNVSAANLPVAWVREAGKLKVNNSVLGRQGLNIDPRSLDLIGNASLLID